MPTSYRGSCLNIFRSAYSRFHWIFLLLNQLCCKSYPDFRSFTSASFHNTGIMCMSPDCWRAADGARASSGSREASGTGNWSSLPARASCARSTEDSGFPENSVASSWYLSGTRAGVTALRQRGIPWLLLPGIIRTSRRWDIG